MTEDNTDPYRKPTRNLATNVSIGAAWLLAMNWGRRLLSIVSTMVLARLLTPDDFGVVALATAFSAILSGFTSMPMGQALIFRQKIARNYYDTAWTLSCARGFLVSILMLVLADPVASFLEEPKLRSIIVVLALQPLLIGLNNPRFIDYQKDLMFSKIALVHMGTAVVYGAVSIGMAIVFRNYWAFIVGTLSSAFVQCIWTYVLKPYRPVPTFSKWRELLGFSAWLSASNAVWSMNLNFDKFVIGGLIGTTSVGYYRLGQELSRLPSRELLPALTQALFPGLAKLGRDLPRMRAKALEANAVLAAIILPFGFGFGLVAEETVRIILGEKWLELVPMLSLMAPILALPGMLATLDPLYLARGRTHVNFIIGTVHFFVRTTLVGVGAYFYGFEGAIYGYAGTAAVDFLVRLWSLGKELAVPVYIPLLRSIRSIIAVLIMSGVVLAVDTAFPPCLDPYACGALLAAKVLAGVVTYTVSHMLLWRLAGAPKDSAERKIIEIVRPFIAKFSI
ncbi:MAG: lipopolysaccharide biosynthesis protein [Alphaproteobacteria bacterium]